MAIVTHSSQQNVFAKVLTAGEHLPQADNNLTATADPTVNDDRLAGWSVNTIWTNTLNGRSFICRDSTPGAAVWSILGDVLNPSSIFTTNGYRYSGTHIVSGDALVPTTAFELNFNSGDIQEFFMPENDVTVTFANPAIGSFVFIVNHAVDSFTMTFPTANFLGEDGPVAKVVSLVGSTGLGYTPRTIFNILYTGSAYEISSSNVLDLQAKVGGVVMTNTGSVYLTATTKRHITYNGNADASYLLPDDYIVSGDEFHIANTSFKVLTIKAHDGTTLRKLHNGSRGVFAALQNVPTNAAHWSASVHHKTKAYDANEAGVVHNNGTFILTFGGDATHDTGSYAPRIRATVSINDDDTFILEFDGIIKWTSYNNASRTVIMSGIAGDSSLYYTLNRMYFPENKAYLYYNGFIEFPEATETVHEYFSGRLLLYSKPDWMD